MLAIIANNVHGQPIVPDAQRSIGMNFTITAVAASIAMFVALALLALLGLIEFKAKRAGRGILVSVVLEAVLAAGFASALLA
jgi:hypothetical protein